jgi:L-lactate dehydrogenase complex protein LldE
MANAGFEKQSIPLAEKFEEQFKGFDYVVSPPVSCTAFIKLNYPRLLKGKTECATAKKAMDVVEFLHDVIKVDHPLGTFPHKVSLHNSCHGVRELGLSSPSEENIPKFNKIKDLLNLVEGIQVLEPERPDECCGFGGMFSVEETAVSEQMGIDKLQRHMKTGARFVTGPDCSCLMHMAGIAKKQGLNVEFKHVVEILAAGL